MSIEHIRMINTWRSHGCFWFMCERIPIQTHIKLNKQMLRCGVSRFQEYHQPKTMDFMIPNVSFWTGKMNSFKRIHCQTTTKTFWRGRKTTRPIHFIAISLFLFLTLKFIHSAIYFPLFVAFQRWNHSQIFIFHTTLNWICHSLNWLCEWMKSLSIFQLELKLWLEKLIFKYNLKRNT